MSEAPGIVSLWTVYDHPKDCPQSYVARRFEIRPDGAAPTPDVIRRATLKRLRAAIQGRGADTCLIRSEDEDPKIVEIWL